MSFVPKVIARGDGKVELASAVKLPNGKFLRDGVEIQAENLAWFADLLEQYLRATNDDRVHKRGGDAVQFSFGGTDWEPRLLIFNFGGEGTSLSLAFDDAPKLVAAVREAAPS